MTEQKRFNGRLSGILITASVGIVVAISGYVIARLDSHEGLDGHAVMVERTTLKFEEIDKKLDLILERLP